MQPRQMRETRRPVCPRFAYFMVRSLACVASSVRCLRMPSMSERFNLLSPEVKANPYPTYARMRREAPVCQVEPGGMWAVSRHEDVLRVLKDPQRFSSQGFRVATNPPWLGGNPFSESMLTMDPPQH